MRARRNSVALVIGCIVFSGVNMLSPDCVEGQVNFVGGFGLSASASTASDCPSFCTGDFDFDSDGGEFAGFASAISTKHGISRSRAYYNNSEFYLPELKAFSSSTGGRGGSATAFGVQGFAYNGTEEVDITIAFALDANVIDSGTFGAESVGASLGVLGLGSVVSGQPIQGPEFYTDFGTWYFENVGNQLGSDSVFVNSPNGTDTSSVTFSVEPGDVFFVGASLSASSRTGTADAFNTFTSTFTDSGIGSQLFIANTAVPEPAALTLFGLVAAGIASRRRRKYFC